MKREEIYKELCEIKEPILRINLLKVLKEKGIKMTYNSLNVQLSYLRKENKIKYTKDHKVEAINPLDVTREKQIKKIENLTEAEKNELIHSYSSFIDTLRIMKNVNKKFIDFMKLRKKFNVNKVVN